MDELNITTHVDTPNDKIVHDAYGKGYMLDWDEAVYTPNTTALSVCSGAYLNNKQWFELNSGGYIQHSLVKPSLEDRKFEAYMEEAKEKIVENFRVSMQKLGKISDYTPASYHYTLEQLLRVLLTDAYAQRSPMTSAASSLNTPMTQGGWAHRQYNDPIEEEDTEDTQPLEPEKHQAIHWLEDRQLCNNGYYNLEKSSFDTYYVYSRYGMRLNVCMDMEELRKFMHDTERQHLEQNIDSNDAWSRVDLDEETWMEGFIK
jgi:hypothetical protein